MKNEMDSQFSIYHLEFVIAGETKSLERNGKE
jgi:hypothetical protein